MIKPLNHEETELSGQWIIQNSTLMADQTCMRIDILIRDYLKEIAVSEEGWEILYQDPADGRYWELTYPRSDLHGGGPPKLTVISSEEAEFKYHIKNQ